jgi:hypothetical protein
MPRELTCLTSPLLHVVFSISDILKYDMKSEYEHDRVWWIDKNLNADSRDMF